MSQYLSLQNNYRAKEDGTSQGCYNLYDLKTNLRVALIDAEAGAIRFTDSYSSFTSEELAEVTALVRTLKVMHKD